MLVDTHAHFFSGEPDIPSLLSRAAAAGVETIVAVGGSAELNAGALAAARCAPLRVPLTLGYDRDHATVVAVDDAAAEMVIAALGKELDETAQLGLKVAGIGETGLDFHYTPETSDAQLRMFRAQLALARDRKLPVVVHSREADESTLAALQEHATLFKGDADRIGVLHCFTGSPAFARELLALGFYISFSGIVTFRNAGPLREAAKSVPVDRLLLETDSPYLAPVPHRGKPNEPAYLVHVAEVIAQVRGCTLGEIAAATSRNAQRLFGLESQ